MVLKLGLRNLLRNKRRSFISALAIGLGLASLILADGVTIGMTQSMVKSVTSSYLGQTQIHKIGYRDNPEVEKSLEDFVSIRDRLNNTSEIAGWSARVLASGMITSPANVINIQMVGINPDKESRVSRLKLSLVEGSYLNDSKQILIGARLSEKLDVRVGEKIVVTVVQSGSGDLTQELFRIGGIYKFGQNGLDDGTAFVLDSKLQQMLGVEGQFHEVVIKFKNLRVSQNMAHPVWKDLEFSGNETESWTKLVPGVMAALEMTDKTTAIVASILFGVVLLGILNTLFMSIYERMYEFGVLQAVGTRPFSVFSMIVSEACWLGFLSVIVGCMMGFLFSMIINITGIDYSGIEMGEATFSEPIYSVYRVQQFTVFPLLLMVFTVLAAVYPGIHAARLTIADAMRRSL